MQTMVTGPIKKLFWIILYPLNYFFYKVFVFTRDYLTIGDYPMRNTSIMALFLILNTFTFYIFIYETLPSMWIFVVQIVIFMPYNSQKISIKLVDKFSRESEKSKVIGSLLVVAYLVLSVILFAKSVVTYQRLNLID